MKCRWNSTISRSAELGLFKDKADCVSVDIQQFVEGEVQHLNNQLHRLPQFSTCFRLYVYFGPFLLSQLNFKCDVVLDTEPVISKVVSLFGSQTYFGSGGCVVTVFCSLCLGGTGVFEHSSVPELWGFLGANFQDQFTPWVNC